MAKLAQYHEYDGLGLAELVRAGEVSPRDLVNEAIERIESLNPSINAVIHDCFARAHEQAGGDLPDGPFRGVPFLLKDLLAEDAGQPCTGSCKLLADWRAERDTELVARYKKAGLIILGRTNAPEFGIYGVTESAMRGPCRNPWDLDHTPGGSSGGSGAAVAARFVPFAHGGDGGGSIRIPASHCGLVGLKPTRGRVPSGPDFGERWAGFVSEHVITRSVRDCAAVLDATSGPAAGDPYAAPVPTRPFAQEVGANPGKLRIGFTTDALFGNESHPDCIEAVQDAARLLEELGHDVVEASPTFNKEELVRAYFVVVAAGVNNDVRTAIERSGKDIGANGFESTTWLLKLIADKVTAGEYQETITAVHRAGRDVARFYDDFDVLLTATTAQPPAKIAQFALSAAEKFQIGLLKTLPAKKLLMLALEDMAENALAATPNTMLFNQTGQPAISVPLYWNGRGLPIGVQLVSRFGDEATLMRMAAQLEEARPWANRLPPVVEGVGQSL